MPVYDYGCSACGHTLEVIHGVNAPGPADCPRCGGSLRKLLSPPAIVFKGTGWAKKDARAASKSSSGDTKPGEAGSDKSAEKSSQKPAQPAASEAASGSD